MVFLNRLVSLSVVFLTVLLIHEFNHIPALNAPFRTRVIQSTATCTALLIDHVQDDDDDDAVLHSSPDSTAPYSQLRPQFHQEQQQQQQQQQHQRQHSISIMNAPFYMQLALITPRNSLEALTMGLDEAAMPALNLPQLQQQKQQQHHQQQQPNRRKSRHNRRSRRKSPCASFCYEHFTKIICGGLLLLFIFNMTLYSYIFYLAHIEGHEF